MEDKKELLHVSIVTGEHVACALYQGLSRLYMCNDGRESFIIKCNNALRLNVDDFGEVGLVYSAS